MIQPVPVEAETEKPPSRPTASPAPAPTRAAPVTPPRLAPAAAPRASSNWNDWKWQLRHRIRTPEQLSRLLPGLPLDEGSTEAARLFPMAITPYYAGLMRGPLETDPIFKMAVPQMEELVDPHCLREDPLAEDEHMPVPGLVHRYRDRALLLCTTMCAMYCRHCTRKRVAGQRETALSGARLQQIRAYLLAHPEIHDVIISGGDPLTLSTPALEQVLCAVRSVPSVDIIRLGSRAPVTLPMRVTDDLVDMLKRFHPLYLNTHFNHPRELTPEAEAACRKLADAGIPLGNQTVLLRGVNDDPVLLADLFRRLLRTRVRPYYLFQCDLVRGVEHFRTPLSRGIEIMEYLRGRLSGLAIPSFVVDMPHGGGKIPLLPNYLISQSPTHTVLRNYEGLMVAYPEPYATVNASPAALTSAPVDPGVWHLANGQRNAIQPQGTARQHRRPRRPQPPVA